MMRMNKNQIKLNVRKRLPIFRAILDDIIWSVLNIFKVMLPLMRMERIMRMKLSIFRAISARVDSIIWSVDK